MGAALLIVFALFAGLRRPRAREDDPDHSAGSRRDRGAVRQVPTTLQPGLNVVTPFVDRVRYVIDMREQVVSFPPQPVITEDNLVVSIDTVIYFQVTDPVAATYEIANYISAIEQLTMTTLRNIVGGMDLEQTLTCGRTSTVGFAACWTRPPDAGDPRRPRRDQGHRPAALDQGLDGEADACRP